MPSRGGEGTVCLLDRVLEAGQDSEHDGSLCSRELAGEREGEGQKDRKTDRHRDPSSDGTRVFYST